MCGEQGESVGHLISGYEILAQREYKRRHDNVAKIVHWTLCRRYGLERAAHWYDHDLKGMVESGEIEVLRHFKIQCDYHIECRKPDIVVVEKEEKKCLIADIAIPNDKNVGVKEEEKIQKYDELKWEIKKLWSMKRVDLVLVVVRALGTVSKKLEKWIDGLGINFKIENLQKTSLLGTARILRKTLEG